MRDARFAATGRSRFAVVARLCIIVLPLLTAGCGARYVQVAEDSFSKGAAIENKAALPTPTNAGATVPRTGGSALINYIDARDNIRLALGKQRNELDSDGLTGAAFALQAMISWRLDALQGSTAGTGDACSGLNYRDCAKTSSEQALALIKNQVTLNADSFMMTILPGLLDHNLGRKATAQTPKDASNEFRSAYTVIGRGLDKLGAAVGPITGSVSDEQELAVYGLRAQFQTLRAWYAALDQASSRDPAVAPDQRLTGDQRLACWQALIFPRGDDVVNKITTLDPGHQAIPVAILNDMKSSLNILPHTAPPGTCPWPSS